MHIYSLEGQKKVLRPQLQHLLLQRVNQVQESWSQEAFCCSLCCSSTYTPVSTVYYLNFSFCERFEDTLSSRKKTDKTPQMPSRLLQWDLHKKQIKVGGYWFRTGYFTGRSSTPRIFLLWVTVSKRSDAAQRARTTFHKVYQALWGRESIILFLFLFLISFRQMKDHFSFWGLVKPCCIHQCSAFPIVGIKIGDKMEFFQMFTFSIFFQVLLPSLLI